MGRGAASRAAEGRARGMATLAPRRGWGAPRKVADAGRDGGNQAIPGEPIRVGRNRISEDPARCRDRVTTAIADSSDVRTGGAARRPSLTRRREVAWDAWPGCGSASLKVRRRRRGSPETWGGADWPRSGRRSASRPGAGSCRSCESSPGGAAWPAGRAGSSQDDANHVWIQAGFSRISPVFSGGYVAGAARSCCVRERVLMRGNVRLTTPGM